MRPATRGTSGPAVSRRTLVAGVAATGAVAAAAGPGSFVPFGHALAAGPCVPDEATLRRVAAAATGELAKFTVMDRPYSLSAFRFTDADGAPKTIADWAGSTVLVNLWATWCAPCRAEMPSLDALQGALGSAGFEVVLISIDRGKPNKPKRFFREIDIRNLDFYHDAEAMTLAELRNEGLAEGLPATLLVDGRGCVIGRLNGPAEWASPDARALVSAALDAR